MIGGMRICCTRNTGRLAKYGLMEYLGWSKHSLDVVLVDDGVGGVPEEHGGLVHPPGHVGDNQTHQEQEARLRDEESQPLQKLGLSYQGLGRMER